MACSGCRKGTTNRHGTVRRGATLAEKIAFHTDLDGPVPADRPYLGPCHVWLGSPSKDGYGNVSYTSEATGRPTSGLAHNLVWRLAFGPLPAGHQADHLCYNRLCVRLDHLESVTRLENVRRAWARRRALGIKRMTKVPTAPLEMAT